MNDRHQTEQERLAAECLSFVEQAMEGIFGPERPTWLERLKQEHARLRATLGWLAQRREAERGLRLAYLLQELWFEESYIAEGREWLATFLALPQAGPTELRAQALDLAGGLALCDEEFAAARALQSESLALFRALDQRSRIGYTLLHLGHAARYSGDDAAARESYEEGLQIFRDLNDPDGIACANGCLAAVVLNEGNPAAARPLVEELLRYHATRESVWHLVEALELASGLAAGLGDMARALRLAGASTAQREAIGFVLPPILQTSRERWLRPARTLLDESVQTAAWSEGRAMTLQQALAFALNEDGGSTPQG